MSYHSEELCHLELSISKLGTGSPAAVQLHVIALPSTAWSQFVATLSVGTAQQKGKERILVLSSLIIL